ncbi:MAG TPA: class I fructose-bisphosphate aldolase [Burkholderiales bacterium]|nr:class I fructose-bisphosphate aldolase [Burkholderiales bacterium]
MSEMEKTAKAMVAKGKGILAADESFPSIKKRFDSIGVESTEETRRTYREMLLTAPGMAQYISGVIFFDETLRQSSAKGERFVDVLKRAGIIPGIKVDTGSKPLAGFPGEEVTEGLDGLRARLQEYVKLGAKFCKWRAVINIGQGIPSPAGIDANAHALARYAGLCQEQGLVPMVEPEVMMESDHSIERCYEVTVETLRRVFNQLADQRVVFENMILKTNMVVPGKKCSDQANVQKVAEMTIRALRTAVPATVAGIVFLSGGQKPEPSTIHLNAMNSMGLELPWPLSFSYGRALQDSSLKTWAGRAENFAAGQKAISHRAKMNGLATVGKYREEMEREAA